VAPAHRCAAPQHFCAASVRSRAPTAYLCAAFALVALGFAAVPCRAESITLTCPGITYRLSTGADGGECLQEAGVRALCADQDSNTVSARCDRGCVGSSGNGSCSLADEESIGGSSVLVCPNGKRYLLRTRTGHGVCRLTGSGETADLFCGDTKHHHAEATCSAGCLSPRGSAICATYKKE
jgi:hypothetical protein